MFCGRRLFAADSNCDLDTSLKKCAPNAVITIASPLCKDNSVKIKS